MSLQRLSLNALASSGGTLLNAVVLFALYRFLVLELGVDAIGVWALVLTAAGIARLAEFGVAAATTKAVANELGAGRDRDAMRALATAWLFLAAALLVGCALAWPIAGWILDATIKEASLRATAGDILPWALAGTWCAGLANLLAATLDGHQRTALRVAGVLSGQLATYALARWLVPEQGIAALGPMMFGGFVLQLVLLVFAVQCIARQPVVLWFAASREGLGSLLRYGSTLQISAIGQLLFEPSVRWLLGVFGDLSLIGLYELASRAVVQARLTLVAGFQMIVPFYATRIGRAGDDLESKRRAYRRTARLMLLVSVPYLALIGAALPYLFTAWIGRHSPVFIVIGYTCLAGWAVNVLAVPAYMLYLAIGRLRWVAINQLVIGVANVALGAALGATFGGPGVIVGAMLALALGSGVVIERYQTEYGVRARDVLPASLGASALIAVTGVSFSAGWALLRWDGASWPWPALAILLPLTLALAAVGWHDPLRVELQGQLLRRPAPLDANGGSAT